MKYFQIDLLLQLENNEMPHLREGCSNLWWCMGAFVHCLDTYIFIDGCTLFIQWIGYRFANLHHLFARTSGESEERGFATVQWLWLVHLCGQQYHHRHHIHHHHNRHHHHHIIMIIIVSKRGFALQKVLVVGWSVHLWSPSPLPSLSWSSSCLREGLQYSLLAVVQWLVRLWSPSPSRASSSWSSLCLRKGLQYSLAVVVMVVGAPVVTEWIHLAADPALPLSASSCRPL